MVVGWALMARGPAAHWRAVAAFVTVTAEAGVICLLLREMTEPDRAKRNTRAVAFMIIIVIMFGWLWIKDLSTLLHALRECCPVG